MSLKNIISAKFRNRFENRKYCQNMLNNALSMKFPIKILILVKFPSETSFQSNFLKKCQFSEISLKNLKNVISVKFSRETSFQSNFLKTCPCSKNFLVKRRFRKISLNNVISIRLPCEMSFQ